MHILVLGASSYIGAALAEAFALNNTLILVGRKVDKLLAAARRCKNSGATQVEYVEQDFCLGVSSVLRAIAGKRVDIVIDAASASASPDKRDSEIELKEITNYVSADFLSRVDILDCILQGQDTAPAMIFVSTVLRFLNSPGRTIYIALKTIYETYLLKLRNKRPDFILLIVYVGTVIDSKNDTNKPKHLASAVFKAFENKKDRLIYGLSGQLLLAMSYLHPMLCHGAIVAQRKIRQFIRR
jgi:short-subunit dehydrogenase